MEVWKNVIGYDGVYQVSTFGRVKKITKNGELIMKNNLNKFGYNLIRFSRNGIQKGISVHRLVAIHFLLNTDNKREVNHKNGIKTDNRVENLEWMTSSENTRHAVANGFHKGIIGEENHNCKITLKDAVFIKYESNHLNSLELSEKFVISRAQVNDIRAGKRWKHI